MSLVFALSLPLVAEPPVIDDHKLTSDLGDKIGKLVEEEKTTPGEDLFKQLERTKADLQLKQPSTQECKNVYSECVDGVGIIASVYKCGKCDKWHRSACATCWTLTEDGIMVTNYHVFKNKDHSGFGVLSRDGRVAPVVEVLAADKETDIAIFRVKGEGFKALKLGDSEEVGNDVHIIAHPDGRFFTYTAGNVSRYYQPRGKSNTVWMAVTAEFAKGSSGGPVLDSEGNVVGMVANTQSIYYHGMEKNGEGKGPFQMVIRNCVPVSSIRKLIKE
ncbi:S1 family peptidase [Rubritalea squalenifaciens]|nr:serine protease [Rubritalea squalenifaciens]